jgi:hypothetical protein
VRYFRAGQPVSSALTPLATYTQMLDMSDLDHLDLFAAEVIDQLGWSRVQSTSPTLEVY